MLKFSLLFSLIFLFWSNLLIAQVKISSWNLQNLGKSKSEAEIEFMAATLKDFDIVAIQEVVAGNGGSQAVARLAAALNRKGVKWDYSISAATESTPYATERYAFLWKTAKIKNKGKGFLDPHFVNEIDREPYMADFSYKNQNFTLVSFHAIPKKKQPETEIKYFKYFPEKYDDRNLIFLGDFNVPQTHTVFNPLKKMKYRPILENQKTTMKMKCVGEEYLASEYDNIFYNSEKTEMLNSGVVLIYKSFPDMVARISDHIPIRAEFDFKGGGGSAGEVLIKN